MEEFQPLSVVDGHFHMHMPLNRTDLVTNLGNIMAACGVDAIAIMSSTGAGRLNENLVTALCKATYPGQVYAFGGLHYHLPACPPEKIDLAAQAKKLRQIGFDGMKMIEGKPTVRQKLGHRLDAPIYDAYYAYLEAKQIPLMLHVADPDSHWQGQAADTFPAKEDLYAEADGILAKFPRLHIIFAHFYFMAHDLERAGRFLDRHPMVNFDLTPGPAMYASFSKVPDKARDFFIRYQDRIIFGTDNHGEARDFAPGAPLEYWPVYKMKAMRTFLETDRAFRGWHYDLKGIALDPPVLEKIYSRNFIRYVGASPRKLDTDQALEECERILSLAQKYAIVHEILPEIRQFMASV
jgi:predicted TIM-barrel fold metal-dependent hydrolase